MASLSLRVRVASAADFFGVEVARQLLGERGAALADRPQRVLSRRRGAPQVDAVVLVEAVVFGGDQGLDHRGRHLVQRRPTRGWPRLNTASSLPSADSTCAGCSSLALRMSLMLGVNGISSRTYSPPRAGSATSHCQRQRARRCTRGRSPPPGPAGVGTACPLAQQRPPGPGLAGQP